VKVYACVIVRQTYSMTHVGSCGEARKSECAPQLKDHARLYASNIVLDVSMLKSSSSVGRRKRYIGYYNIVPDIRKIWTTKASP
jgi:hypothetical protein